MAGRTKKPPVRPELRREWLRRFEEAGESVPQIAKADGYDVRTVRKQIELTRQEREVREARSMVLRHALEMHYADLVSFAKTLDSAVQNAWPPSGNMKSDRLWAALREHLPHSPLWRAMNKMESLHHQLQAIERQAEEHLREEVGRKAPLGFASEVGQPGLHWDGLARALSHHLAQEGNHQVFDFRTVGPGGELTEVVYGGAWTLAWAPDSQVPGVMEFLADLMAQVGEWPEREQRHRVRAESRRVTEVVSEELAVIMLRRVIPGRCRYCPV